MKDVELAHPQVCDPTEVLDLVLAHLPVLNEIDPHIRVRCIERHVSAKAKPMTDACGAIVPLITGPTHGNLHQHLPRTGLRHGALEHTDVLWAKEYNRTHCLRNGALCHTSSPPSTALDPYGIISQA